MYRTAYDTAVTASLLRKGAGERGDPFGTECWIELCFYGFLEGKFRLSFFVEVWEPIA